MKHAGKIVLCILVLVMMAGLAACGGGSSSDSTTPTITDAAPADTQDVVLPTPDTKLGVDSVLGNWTDITAATRFAKITKTDTGYQYEDPEGTYPATFADGVLKVKASETDNVDVYYDAASSNLISVYQGTPTRFKK